MSYVFHLAIILNKDIKSINFSLKIIYKNMQLLIYSIFLYDAYLINYII